MSHKIEEHTEIYSYPVSPKVSREKMIHVSKQMSRLGKNARNKAKRSIYKCQYKNVEKLRIRM